MWVNTVPHAEKKTCFHALAANIHKVARIQVVQSFRMLCFCANDVKNINVAIYTRKDFETVIVICAQVCKMQGKLY